MANLEEQQHLFDLVEKRRGGLRASIQFAEHRRRNEHRMSDLLAIQGEVHEQRTAG